MRCNHLIGFSRMGMIVDDDVRSFFSQSYRYRFTDSLATAGD